MFLDGLPEPGGRVPRRCMGQPRRSASRAVAIMVPGDPVNLAVYSPRWINPETCSLAMRERAGFGSFSTRATSRPRSPACPADSPRADRSRSRSWKAELGPRARTSPPRSPRPRVNEGHSATSRQVVDGHFHEPDVVARCIDVHAVPTPPRPALGAVDGRAIIEYQVRWLPTSAPTPGVIMMSRNRSPESRPLDVEKAAGMIATLVGGKRRPTRTIPRLAPEEISPRRGIVP